jgi:hypothetical protein
MTSSRDLESLKSGRLGPREYLQARLRLAMRPLRSRLSARQFRAVTRLLERGLAVDPLVLRFVREVLRTRDEAEPSGPRPSDPGGVR